MDNTAKFTLLLISVDIQENVWFLFDYKHVKLLVQFSK